MFILEIVKSNRKERKDRATKIVEDGMQKAFMNLFVVNIFLCVFACACECVHARARVCVCVCVCVCMY